MTARFCILACFFLGCSLVASAYNDHRGHNLDSLERVVARWTPDRVDQASEEELVQLNRDYRDLMLGYNVINGEKTIYYAHKALDISQPRGWEEANSDAYRYIGLQFYGREQYDSAMVYFLAANTAIDHMMNGATSPTNPEGYSARAIDDARSALYGTIGNLYNVMDSIPQAIYWYEKAGEIFDQYGWNESNSILYYNIGETWLDEGQYRQAAEAYEKALSYAEISGDSLMIVQAFKGLGKLYMEKKQSWKSLPYLRKADAYYEAHPDDSPVFRRENLEVIEQVLSQQKRQLTWVAVGLLLLLGLGGAVWRRARFSAAAASAPADPAAGAAASPAPAVPAPRLKPRERDVLRLLANGYTTAQIAEALHLSGETIRWYRKRLLATFDVSNTPELISRAKESGLI